MICLKWKWLVLSVRRMKSYNHSSYLLLVELLSCCMFVSNSCVCRKCNVWLCGFLYVDYLCSWHVVAYLNTHPSPFRSICNSMLFSHDHTSNKQQNLKLLIKVYSIKRGLNGAKVVLNNLAMTDVHRALVVRSPVCAHRLLHGIDNGEQSLS